MNNALTKLLSKYPELHVCSDDIELAFETIKNSFNNGGKLLLCGNGGSASDCEHIVGELMKGFMKKRELAAASQKEFMEQWPLNGEYLAKNLQGALPAISLTSNSALMTAYSNDVAADMAFAQQVYGYGNTGDVLLGISTSGNSANVLNAIQVAKVLGVNTIALTGKTGGRMKEYCDISICVPYESTPDIQDRHLPIYHTLCIMLEESFFREEK
ncbi:MAG: SIS domain-containing protein [Clostridiales bacterium]|nr:SIS domain-containing protein [Clostridiales bacterium]